MSGTNAVRFNSAMLRRGAWILGILLVGYLLLPFVAGNLATTALTRSMHCTRYVTTCAAGMNDSTAGWQNEPFYGTLTSLIAMVRAITPDIAHLRLRQAELLVAQGNFQPAAMLIEALPAPEYHYSDEVEGGVTPSRLFINGTPEQAVLAAYQQAAEGNRVAALAALRVAIATAPELLGDEEWNLYADLTESPFPIPNRPTANSVEYALADSASWRGMDIIGVGLDTSTFTANGSGPITIWLKVLNDTPPPNGIEVESGVWQVPYRGVNLAPNPGFEWGSATVPKGVIPQGYFAFVDTAGTPGITFPMVDGNTSLSILGNGIQSISSYPLAVDPNALYLMGATVHTTGRFAMGRRCFPAEGTNRLNLSIHPLRETDVRAEWTLLNTTQPVAHIGLADPSHPATLCQFILEAEGGESTLDDVFLIKLE
jgi:hypothetical protein